MNLDLVRQSWKVSVKLTISFILKKYIQSMMNSVKQ